MMENYEVELYYKIQNLVGDYFWWRITFDEIAEEIGINNNALEEILIRQRIKRIDAEWQVNKQNYRLRRFPKERTIEQCEYMGIPLSDAVDEILALYYQ
jgi:hypothetical protein